MICAYCNKERKATKEHIIPAGILDIFPECDLSYSVKYDKHFKGDAVIKDVCEVCNNEKLSDLDSYGREIIMEHFSDEDFGRNSYYEFSFDYHNLARWIMKIAYNDARSNGFNDQFFENNRDYMLGDTSKSNGNFSLYAGYSINTSVAPSHYFGNFQITIMRKPLMNKTGIFGFDYERFGITYNTTHEIYNQNEEHLIYLVKFGSGMFMLVAWNKNLDGDDLESEMFYVQHLFPYTLLREDMPTTLLFRCSHAYNYHHPFIVDSRDSLGYADAMNSHCKPEVDVDQLRNVLDEGWQEHVETLRQEHKEKKARKRKPVILDRIP